MANLDPSELPSESRHLLEIDFGALGKDTLERQSYWLLAIKAAHRAGRRTAHLRRQRDTGARAQRYAAAQRGARRSTPLSLRTRKIERDVEVKLGLRPSPSRKHATLRATERLGTGRRSIGNRTRVWH